MSDQPYQQPQFPPPPPPAPKRKTGLIIGIIVGVVVLLLCLCGVGIFFAVRSGVSRASRGIPTTPRWATASPRRSKRTRAAKHKVVGIVGNVTESEFDADNQTICDAYPDWENVIWLGRQGGNGKALCLAPVTGR